MIRTFVVAVVTIISISIGLLEAQSTGAPAQGGRIPVSVVGGTPGVSIEFFMDAGKLADATVNAAGGVDWVLDLANRGKTRVTIYVDVCKDGKIVKVMFVTGSGQAPPEDDGCNRRIAAVSFQSDCGVTRITLNFANFGANVIGCGGLSFRDPKVFAPVGGAVALLPFLIGGGDDAPRVSGGVPQQPTVNLPSTPPANTTTPAPAPPAPPAQPTADSFNGQYTGNLTVTENVCRFLQTAGFAARLNVNSSGNGTLEFTYIASGQQQLYVFTNVMVRMSGNQGTFETETNSTQFGYRLIVQGMLSGNTFGGRISFFDTRPGNCHTGYVVNGTKQ